MIKNNNYITIQGWMVSELKLSDKELLCYSIIYGFSQDETTVFTGPLSYLCEWIGCSKPTIINTLKSLVKKELIIKNENIVNNIKFCSYKVNLTPLKKFNWGGKETLIGGSKEILPNNNKDNNNKYNTEFEEFWELYPKQRRGNKQKAYRSYCRVLNENRCTIKRLLDAVKLYSNSKTVKDGYAKGCEAWLNDDRFNWVYEQASVDRQSIDGECWWRS